MKSIYAYLSVIMVILSGCAKNGGGDTTPVAAKNDSWPSYSVSTINELPTCAGDIVGRLYYVETSNTFQVCKSTGWTTVNIQGQDGRDGMLPSSNINCFKTVGGIAFRYQAVLFTTGDKIISCELADSASSYFNSSFYSHNQSGSINELCTITYDIDSAHASGWWSFTLNNNVRSFVYHNVGSSNDGMIINYDPNDCTTTEL